jgi:hypothetical protein
MVLDANNFMISLTAAIAALAGNLQVGRDICEGTATEADCASVYSVVRDYAAPTPEPLDRIDALTIQVMTTGKQGATRHQVKERAHVLFEALFEDDADGVPGARIPRGQWTIAAKKLQSGAVVDDPALPRGYLVLAVEMGSPPVIFERDAEGRRWSASFNFTATYQAKEA